MPMIRVRVPNVFLLIMLMLFQNSANAQSLLGLQKANKLIAKVWIETPQPIVAYQQVNLNIEIATDKRFAKGTRIKSFNIDDAVVLQREKFAVNATRFENGSNWQVQTWTVVVYPQRSGRFDIPKIPIDVSVLSEQGDTISGEIFTAKQGFNAIVPTVLQDDEHWIAASNFSVKETFNKPIDESLKLADAVTRTIRFSAEDTVAMMLPKIETSVLEGVAVYQKPPQLIDKVNRGDYQAERVETITYVMEQEGQFMLPELTFKWWNTRLESLEVIVLPAHYFWVGSEVSINNEATADNEIEAKINLNYLLVIICFVLLVLLFIVMRFYKKKRQQPEKILRYQFIAACKQHDTVKAISLLYQWLDIYAPPDYNWVIRDLIEGQDNSSLSNMFNEFIMSIYSNANQDSDYDLEAFSIILVASFERNQSKGKQDKTTFYRLN